PGRRPDVRSNGRPASALSAREPRSCRLPRDCYWCEPAAHDQSTLVAAMPLFRPPDARPRDGWCSPGAVTAGPTARSLSPRVGPRAHDRNGDNAITRLGVFLAASRVTG